MSKENFHANVFVGSETGLLKGVNVGKQKWENLNKSQQVDKQKEIKVMCWSSQNKDELNLGLRDHTVLTYGVSERQITRSTNIPARDGQYVGLAKYQGKFITCVDTGLLQVWDGSNVSQVEVDAGANLHRMRQNPSEPHLVATGGKENELKIWDLQQPSEPVFKAKNVRPDFLQLRVPVWVLDMTFLPGSRKVVTCTGHHQVRVYDPGTTQRRPVLEMTFDEYPLVSMGLVPGGNQVVVGNTQGKMGMVDIRKSGHMVQTYKGFAGSIRSIECHATKPVVASCGLDRHLRIHDLHSKELLQKIYLKSRLNCLLLYDDWEGSKEDSDNNEITESNLTTKSAEDNSDSDDEVDELWEKMDIVGSKKNILMGSRGKVKREKMKRKQDEEPPSKKKKKLNVEREPTVSKGKMDRKHKKRKCKKTSGHGSG